MAGLARQSVAGGAAVLTVGAGNNTGAYLAGVSATDVDVRTTVSLSATPTGGSGALVYVTGRRVGTDQYRGRLQVLPTGAVGVALIREVGGVETVLGNVTVPGLTYTPGMQLEVRLRVTGSGTTGLELSVWQAGAPAPATPTLARTDGSATLAGARHDRDRGLPVGQRDRSGRRPVRRGHGHRRPLIRCSTPGAGAASCRPGTVLSGSGTTHRGPVTLGSRGRGVPSHRMRGRPSG